MGFLSLRAAGLSVLAALGALSVLRYPAILACADTCAFNVACAALLAGAAFWANALWRTEAPFWDSLRSRLAGLACLLWGLYLLAYSRNFTLWMLDLGFFTIALLLWLGRHRADCMLAALGIVLTVAFRHLGSEAAVILFDIAFLAGVLFKGGHRVQEYLSRPAEPAPPASRLKIAGTAALFVFLTVNSARPIWLMASPDKRNQFFKSISPTFPVNDPGTLSPLASTLRQHVLALSEKIGERSAYTPDAQEKAKDYVAAQLRAAGYAPELFPYTGKNAGFERKVPYYNVEARLDPAASGLPAWVLGAHYDTSPGTPGADDNASGVAVLLEVARILRAKNPGRSVRFVAFGTEEPPAFGMRDMGSLRYAQSLKAEGVRVFALLNLEMLGYFNPKAKSQLHPPFLHLFYPDHADFIGLVSNAANFRLALAVRKAWSQGAKVPMETVVLPSAFSTVALSDQLNFWSAGYPAVMLSDTSFFRSPHYHQSSDTPEKLDYEKMAVITQGVADVLTAL